MKENIPILLFTERKDFRKWLSNNSETSSGVWLTFSKNNNLITISANDALEEALSFGWIDGQLKSIDDTKYLKYFSHRLPNSVWSERNKKLVQILRDKKLMTEQGEKIIQISIKNGQWDTKKNNNLAENDLTLFIEKIKEHSLAYENFCKMSPSIQKVYNKRYLSFKTEEVRQKDFLKIIDRLNKNLKPM